MGLTSSQYIGGGNNINDNRSVKYLNDLENKFSEFLNTSGYYRGAGETNDRYINRVLNETNNVKLKHEALPSTIGNIRNYMIDGLNIRGGNDIEEHNVLYEANDILSEINTNLNTMVSEDVKTLNSSSSKIDNITETLDKHGSSENDLKDKTSRLLNEQKSFMNMVSQLDEFNNLKESFSDRSNKFSELKNNSNMHDEIKIMKYINMLTDTLKDVSNYKAMKENYNNSNLSMSPNFISELDNKIKTMGTSPSNEQLNDFIGYLYTNINDANSDGKGSVLNIKWDELKNEYNSSGRYSGGNDITLQNRLKSSITQDYTKRNKEIEAKANTLSIKLNGVADDLNKIIPDLRSLNIIQLNDMEKIFKKFLFFAAFKHNNIYYILLDYYIDLQSIYIKKDFIVKLNNLIDLMNKGSVINSKLKDIGVKLNEVLSFISNTNVNSLSRTTQSEDMKGTYNIGEGTTSEDANRRKDLISNMSPISDVYNMKINIDHDRLPDLNVVSNKILENSYKLLYAIRLSIYYAQLKDMNVDHNKNYEDLVGKTIGYEIDKIKEDYTKIMEKLVQFESVGVNAEFREDKAIELNYPIMVLPIPKELLESEIKYEYIDIKKIFMYLPCKPPTRETSSNSRDHRAWGRLDKLWVDDELSRNVTLNSDPINGDDLRKMINNYKEYFTNFYESIIGLHMASQAIDIYLKNFTEKIRKTPEMIEKLDSLLANSNVHSMLHTNKMVDKLIDVFDPNNYNRETSASTEALQGDINKWCNNTVSTHSYCNESFWLSKSNVYQIQSLDFNYIMSHTYSDSAVEVNYSDNKDYILNVDNNYLNDVESFKKQTSILSKGSGACDTVKPMYDLIANRSPDNGMNRGGLHNRHWSSVPGKMNVIGQLFDRYVDFDNITTGIKDIKHRSDETLFHELGSAYYEKYIPNYEETPLKKMKELKDFYKHNTTLMNILSLFFSMIGVDKSESQILSPSTIQEYLINFMCWGSYTLTNVPSTVDINIGNGIPMVNGDYSNSDVGINFNSLKYLKQNNTSTEDINFGMAMFSYLINLNTDLNYESVIENTYQIMFSENSFIDILNRSSDVGFKTSIIASSNYNCIKIKNGSTDKYSIDVTPRNVPYTSPRPFELLVKVKDGDGFNTHCLNYMNAYTLEKIVNVFKLMKRNIPKGLQTRLNNSNEYGRLDERMFKSPDIYGNYITNKNCPLLVGINDNLSVFNKTYSAMNVFDSNVRVTILHSNQLSETVGSKYANSIQYKSQVLYSNVIKSLIGKILTVIGLYEITDIKNGRPWKTYIMDTTRLTLGGNIDTIGSVVDDSLVEFYIRIPLLLKFYKMIFYDITQSNDNMDNNFKFNNSDTESVKIIPEFDPPFDQLIKHFFIYYNGTSTYNIGFNKTLFEHINKIYKHLKAKYSSDTNNSVDMLTYVCRELIKEINQKYGLLFSSDLNIYKSKISKQFNLDLDRIISNHEIDTLIEGNVLGNLSSGFIDDPSKLPSQKYTKYNNSYKSGTSNNELRFNARNYYDNIHDFRKFIQSVLTDSINDENFTKKYNLYTSFFDIEEFISKMKSEIKSTNMTEDEKITFIVSATNTQKTSIDTMDGNKKQVIYDYIITPLKHVDNIMLFLSHVRAMFSNEIINSDIENKYSINGVFHKNTNNTSLFSIPSNSQLLYNFTYPNSDYTDCALYGIIPNIPYNDNAYQLRKSFVPFQEMITQHSLNYDYNYNYLYKPHTFIEYVPDAVERIMASYNNDIVSLNSVSPYPNQFNTHMKSLSNLFPYYFGFHNKISLNNLGYLPPDAGVGNVDYTDKQPNVPFINMISNENILNLVNYDINNVVYSKKHDKTNEYCSNNVIYLDSQYHNNIETGQGVYDEFDNSSKPEYGLLACMVAPIVLPKSILSTAIDKANKLQSAIAMSDDNIINTLINDSELVVINKEAASYGKATSATLLKSIQTGRRISDGILIGSKYGMYAGKGIPNFPFNFDEKSKEEIKTTNLRLIASWCPEEFSPNRLGLHENSYIKCGSYQNRAYYSTYSAAEYIISKLLKNCELFDLYSTPSINNTFTVSGGIEISFNKVDGYIKEQLTNTTLLLNEVKNYVLTDILKPCEDYIRSINSKYNDLFITGALTKNNNSTKTTIYSIQKILMKFLSGRLETNDIKFNAKGEDISKDIKRENGCLYLDPCKTTNELEELEHYGNEYVLLDRLNKMGARMVTKFINPLMFNSKEAEKFVYQPKRLGYIPHQKLTSALNTKDDYYYGKIPLEFLSDIQGFNISQNVNMIKSCDLLYVEPNPEYCNFYFTNIINSINHIVGTLIKAATNTTDKKIYGNIINIFKNHNELLTNSVNNKFENIESVEYLGDYGRTGHGGFFDKSLPFILYNNINPDLRINTNIEDMTNYKTTNNSIYEPKSNIPTSFKHLTLSSIDGVTQDSYLSSYICNPPNITVDTLDFNIDPFKDKKDCNKYKIFKDSHEGKYPSTVKSIMYMPYTQNVLNNITKYQFATNYEYYKQVDTNNRLNISASYYGCMNMFRTSPKQKYYWYDIIGRLGFYQPLLNITTNSNIDKSNDYISSSSNHANNIIRGHLNDPNNERYFRGMEARASSYPRNASNDVSNYIASRFKYINVSNFINANVSDLDKGRKIFSKLYSYGSIKPIKFVYNDIKRYDYKPVFINSYLADSNITSNDENPIKQKSMAAKWLKSLDNPLKVTHKLVSLENLQTNAEDSITYAIVSESLHGKFTPLIINSVSKGIIMDGVGDYTHFKNLFDSYINNYNYEPDKSTGADLSKFLFFNKNGTIDYGFMEGLVANAIAKNVPDNKAYADYITTNTVPNEWSYVRDVNSDSTYDIYKIIQSASDRKDPFTGNNHQSPEGINDYINVDAADSRARIPNVTSIPNPTGVVNPKFSLESIGMRPRKVIYNGMNNDIQSVPYLTNTTYKFPRSNDQSMRHNNIDDPKFYGGAIYTPTTNIPSSSEYIQDTSNIEGYGNIDTGNDPRISLSRGGIAPDDTYPNTFPADTLRRGIQYNEHINNVHLFMDKSSAYNPQYSSAPKSFNKILNSLKNKSYKNSEPPRLLVVGYIQYSKDHLRLGQAVACYDPSTINWSIYQPLQYNLDKNENVCTSLSSIKIKRNNELYTDIFHKLTYVKLMTELNSLDCKGRINKINENNNVLASLSLCTAYSTPRGEYFGSSIFDYRPVYMSEPDYTKKLYMNPLLGHEQYLLKLSGAHRPNDKIEIIKPYDPIVSYDLGANGFWQPTGENPIIKDAYKIISEYSILNNNIFYVLGQPNMFGISNPYGVNGGVLQSRNAHPSRFGGNLIIDGDMVTEMYPDAYIDLDRYLKGHDAINKVERHIKHMTAEIHDTIFKANLDKFFTDDDDIYRYHNIHIRNLCSLKGIASSNIKNYYRTSNNAITKGAFLALSTIDTRMRPYNILSSVNDDTRIKNNTSSNVINSLVTGGAEASASTSTLNSTANSLNESILSVMLKCNSEPLAIKLGDQIKPMENGAILYHTYTSAIKNMLTNWSQNMETKRNIVYNLNELSEDIKENLAGAIPYLLSELESVKSQAKLLGYLVLNNPNLINIKVSLESTIRSVKKLADVLYTELTPIKNEFDTNYIFGELYKGFIKQANVNSSSNVPNISFSAEYYNFLSNCHETPIRPLGNKNIYYKLNNITSQHSATFFKRLYSIRKLYDKNAEFNITGTVTLEKNIKKLNESLDKYSKQLNVGYINKVIDCSKKLKFTPFEECNVNQFVCLTNNIYSYLVNTNSSNTVDKIIEGNSINNVFNIDKINPETLRLDETLKSKINNMYASPYISPVNSLLFANVGNKTTERNKFNTINNIIVDSVSYNNDIEFYKIYNDMYDGFVESVNGLYNTVNVNDNNKIFNISGFRDALYKDSSDNHHLMIFNILDLNIVPIDINALTREIPLFYIFNYSTSLDEFISNSLESYKVDQYYNISTINSRINSYVNSFMEYLATICPSVSDYHEYLTDSVNETKNLDSSKLLYKNNNSFYNPNNTNIDIWKFKDGSFSTNNKSETDGNLRYLTKFNIAVNFTNNIYFNSKSHRLNSVSNLQDSSKPYIYDYQHYNHENYYNGVNLNIKTDATKFYKNIYFNNDYIKNKHDRVSDFAKQLSNDINGKDVKNSLDKASIDVISNNQTDDVKYSSLNTHNFTNIVLTGFASNIIKSLLNDTPSLTTNTYADIDRILRYRYPIEDTSGLDRRQINTLLNIGNPYVHDIYNIFNIDIGEMLMCNIVLNDKIINDGNNFHKNPDFYEIISSIASVGLFNSRYKIFGYNTNDLIYKSSNRSYTSNYNSSIFNNSTSGILGHPLIPNIYLNSFVKQNIYNTNYYLFDDGDTISSQLIKYTKSINVNKNNNDNCNKNCVHEICEPGFETVPCINWLPYDNNNNLFKNLSGDGGCLITSLVNSGKVMNNFTPFPSFIGNLIDYNNEITPHKEVYRDMPYSTYYNLSCLLSDIDSSYIDSITKLNKLENASFMKITMNDLINKTGIDINELVRLKSCSSWGISDPRSIGYIANGDTFYKKILFTSRDTFLSNYMASSGYGVMSRQPLINNEIVPIFSGATKFIDDMESFNVLLSTYGLYNNALNDFLMDNKIPREYDGILPLRTTLKWYADNIETNILNSGIDWYECNSAPKYSTSYKWKRIKPTCYFNHVMPVSPTFGNIVKERVHEGNKNSKIITGGNDEILQEREDENIVMGGNDKLFNKQNLAGTTELFKLLSLKLYDGINNMGSYNYLEVENTLLNFKYDINKIMQVNKEYTQFTQTLFDFTRSIVKGTSNNTDNSAIIGGLINNFYDYVNIKVATHIANFAVFMKNSITQTPNKINCFMATIQTMESNPNSMNTVYSKLYRLLLKMTGISGTNSGFTIDGIINTLINYLTQNKINGNYLKTITKQQLTLALTNFNSLMFMLFSCDLYVQVKASGNTNSPYGINSTISSFSKHLKAHRYYINGNRQQIDKLTVDKVLEGTERVMMPLPSGNDNVYEKGSSDNVEYYNLAKMLNLNAPDDIYNYSEMLDVDVYPYLYIQPLHIHNKYQSLYVGRFMFEYEALIYNACSYNNQFQNCIINLSRSNVMRTFRDNIKVNVNNNSLYLINYITSIILKLNKYISFGKHILNLSKKERFDDVKNFSNMCFINDNVQLTYNIQSNHTYLNDLHSATDTPYLLYSTTEDAGLKYRRRALVVRGSNVEDCFNRVFNEMYSTVSAGNLSHLHPNNILLTRDNPSLPLKATLFATFDALHPYISLSTDVIYPVELNTPNSDKFEYNWNKTDINNNFNNPSLFIPTNLNIDSMYVNKRNKDLGPQNYLLGDRRINNYPQNTIVNSAINLIKGSGENTKLTLRGQGNDVSLTSIPRLSLGQHSSSLGANVSSPVNYLTTGGLIEEYIAIRYMSPDEPKYMSPTTAHDHVSNMTLPSTLRSTVENNTSIYDKSPLFKVPSNPIGLKLVEDSHNSAIIKHHNICLTDGITAADLSFKKSNSGTSITDQIDVNRKIHVLSHIMYNDDTFGYVPLRHMMLLDYGYNFIRYKIAQENLYSTNKIISGTYLYDTEYHNQRIYDEIYGSNKSDSSTRKIPSNPRVMPRVSHNKKQ